MKVSIREAVRAEADEIAAMRRAAAEDLTRRFGPGPWSSDTTAAGVRLAMQRGRMIVASQSGKIVGTFTLSAQKPWAIDARYFTRVKTPVYLTSMAIDPGAQRQGVGRALLADAESRAKSWPGGPGRAIRLDAFDANAGAGDFYRKCGYVECGRTVFRAVALIYFERVLRA